MPDSMMKLEERLQDVLETHGLEDIAMMLFHHGITSCQDLVEIRTKDHEAWRLFLGKIHLQYHVLGRRGMEFLGRLMDAACEEAARQGPVSAASMRMPPPGTVLSEPTGQSM